MKKLAKILVLVLSLALVMGALVMAIGAEEALTYSYTDVATDEPASTDSLAEAIENAKENAKLNGVYRSYNGCYPQG